MSMVYNQIYKCRKCGAEFCPVTTHGFEEASVSMTNFIERANGVTDFIGYEKQEL